MAETADTAADRVEYDLGETQLKQKRMSCVAIHLLLAPEEDCATTPLGKCCSRLRYLRYDIPPAECRTASEPRQSDGLGTFQSGLSDTPEGLTELFGACSPCQPIGHIPLAYHVDVVKSRGQTKYEPSKQQTGGIGLGVRRISRNWLKYSASRYAGK